MKTVYKRTSHTEEVETFQFEGPTTVHCVVWPIENTPHAGVLLVADKITMGDGATGTALLLDLKRRGQKTYQSVICIGLFTGDLKYAHTTLSLLFSIPPAVEPLFTIPGKQLDDLSEGLMALDRQPFSLYSEEKGCSCVSLVNDMICHYTNSQIRYRLHFTTATDSLHATSLPSYSIERTA